MGGEACLLACLLVRAGVLDWEDRDETDGLSDEGSVAHPQVSFPSVRARTFR